MTYRRQIGAIEKLADLKPGDILLFRPAKQPFWSNSIIKFFQGALTVLDEIEQGLWLLLNLYELSDINTLEHGHYDTIHAAVCVAHDEKGEPVIAHSYEVGKHFLAPGGKKVEIPWRGYVRETLQHMFDNEKKLNQVNEERHFLVFRPKNQEAAQAVAAVAGDEKANAHIQWTYSQAAKTWTRPAFWRMATDRPFNKDRKIPDEAICSQFVISAVKVAEAKRLADAKGELKAIPDRINMQECSTPMALESYLYKDQANYELLVYAGKNAFEDLHKAIMAETDRIERNDPFGPNSSAKYRGIRAQCTKIKVWSDSKECKENDFTKALTLLRIVMPMLNKPQNWYSMFNTTSYNNIKSAARGMGIFEREFAHAAPKDNKAMDQLCLTPEEHERDKTAEFFGIQGKKNGR